MDLKGRVSEYEKMEKNHRRIFSQRDCGSIRLYSLPNGISIFEAPGNVSGEEGMVFEADKNDFGFDYKIVEKGEQNVIIQAINIKK